VCAFRTGSAWALLESSQNRRFRGTPQKVTFLTIWPFFEIFAIFSECATFFKISSFSGGGVQGGVQGGRGVGGGGVGGVTPGGWGGVS
jgi:hypothetical protein